MQKGKCIPTGNEVVSIPDIRQIIACESVDENTGECTTREAFATCAGFLVYFKFEAFKNERFLWM